jgi:nicotinate dehydrogenase subunit B
VKELKALPDQDIRAMAVYPGILQRGRTGQTSRERPCRQTGECDPFCHRRLSRRAHLSGACAVCHEVGGPALFGSRPSLSLNQQCTQRRARQSDPGNPATAIAAPVSPELGYMPAFKDSLTDRQLAELVAYLRRAICTAQAGLDRHRRRHCKAKIGRYSLKSSPVLPVRALAAPRPAR